MNLLTDFWELFFPRCCAICGKRLLGSEEQLCFHCLSALPRTQFHLSEENELAQSLWGKLAIVRAGAFLHYAKGGSVQRLLYELKYYGNSRLGRFLGRCMATELLPCGFFDGMDWIIPVPLHAKKRKLRGYNQSEMLAEGLSWVSRVPMLQKVVVRRQFTETQTRKGNYERWENVKDAFEYTSCVDLRNKHVLLVDDVWTTGATLVACADALKGIPGLQISILTLAWAGET